MQKLIPHAYNICDCKWGILEKMVTRWNEQHGSRNSKEALMWRTDELSWRFLHFYMYMWPADISGTLLSMGVYTDRFLHVLQPSAHWRWPKLDWHHRGHTTNLTLSKSQMPHVILRMSMGTSMMCEYSHFSASDPFAVISVLDEESWVTEFPVTKTQASSLSAFIGSTQHFLQMNPHCAFLRKGEICKNKK